MVSCVGGERMLEVGRILKEERERQGLTVEDISARTRFNTSQIEAIERGDLDYFRDDLSYVKFFVQFYCKTLGIDFSQFKDEFDENMVTYTTMLTQQEVESLRKANEKLKKKVQGQHKKKRKKLRLRMDASVISMLIIAFVMIAALSFAFGRYIFPDLMNNQNNEEPAITTPKITITENTTTSTSNVIVKEACELEFKQESYNTYNIVYSGNCEDIVVKVKFAHRTWVDASINGERTNTPKSNYTYGTGEEIEYHMPVSTGSKLTLNMGYFKGNQFYVNDEMVELDSSIRNSASGNTVYFTLKGE